MKVHFLISGTSKSCEVLLKLKHIDNVPAEEADVFVVFGGDGFMLKMMRQYQHYKKPFYGINAGNVGFLMNDPNTIDAHNFFDMLSVSCCSVLPVLEFELTKTDHTVIRDYAINEISFMRQTAMASKISVYVKNEERIICRGDGLLLSTPAGSTAYNASAGGPIIPLGFDLVVLTPLSVYEPRNWRGAILPDHDEFEFVVHDAQTRKVQVTFDNNMIQDIHSAKVKIDKKNTFRLLFNPDTCLDDRIINEQFNP
ncbi:MAG: NAD kinase [Alphaproteobacteria bacterium]|nr:NAD kinase [Alphaproteobacteria bacterium]